MSQIYDNFSYICDMIDILEKIKTDFDSAETIKLKTEILKEFIKTNPTETESFEWISNAQDIIEAMKEEEETEESDRINIQIEQGLYSMWKCQETIYPFVKGEDYWIRQDDMSKELMEKWSDVMTPEIQEYIGKIKPIVWIAYDSGLGTLKRKTEFDADINQYFEKYENI